MKHLSVCVLCNPEPFLLGASFLNIKHKVWNGNVMYYSDGENSSDPWKSKNRQKFDTKFLSTCHTFFIYKWKQTKKIWEFRIFGQVGMCLTWQMFIFCHTLSKVFHFTFTCIENALQGSKPACQVSDTFKTSDGSKPHGSDHVGSLLSCPFWSMPNYG